MKWILDDDSDTDRAFWPDDMPKEYLGENGKLKLTAVSNLLCSLLNRVQELEDDLETRL